MPTKLEILQNILNEFDPSMLEQCQMQYRRLERHPWMKYRKDQLETASSSAKENFYRLELGGNMAWYKYICDHLKKNR